jgi:hypothetical protein
LLARSSRRRSDSLIDGLWATLAASDKPRFHRLNHRPISWLPAGVLCLPIEILT